MRLAPKPHPTTWPLGLILLTALTLLMLLGAAYMAFVYAPSEKLMGEAQRIFYFHVGAAWAGALAFLVTVVAGIAYLRTGSCTWDRIGLSSVEVGLALISITLLSGPIWAQSAWGKPWDWDPKLTSAAVMWLSYAAYILLRQGLEDPARQARFGAIYGIVAFASVIMTYIGVRFVRTTLHPSVIGPSAGTGQGDFGLEARMAHALVASFIAFTFVYATLLWHRVRLEQLADRVNRLRAHWLARQE